MADWQQLEAFLFASGDAFSEEQLARHLGTTMIEVRVLLDELQSHLGGHGIRLTRQEGGISLTTAPELGGFLGESLPRAPGELSAAALEALALVAYRQPVSRAEIDESRGVRSERTLQTLVELGLIEVVGRTSIGRSPLYGTTVEFLRRFDLESLADLPDLPQAQVEEEKL